MTPELLAGVLAGSTIALLATLAISRVVNDALENTGNEQSDADRAVDHSEIVIADHADFDVIDCGGCAPPVLAHKTIGAVPTTPDLPRVHETPLDHERR